MPVFGQKKGREGTLQVKMRDGKVRELSLETGLTMSRINCDSLLIGSEWIKEVSQIVPIPCDSASTSVVESNIPSNSEVLELAVYPNPSNGQVTLVINSPASDIVNLEVFSVLGVLVHQFEMINSTKLPTEINWDFKNSGGRVLTSGIYLIRAITQRGTVTRLIEIF